MHTSIFTQVTMRWTETDCVLWGDHLGWGIAGDEREVLLRCTEQAGNRSRWAQFFTPNKLFRD